MEKIFLSPEDRKFINDLSRRGLRVTGLHQWHVARLAFARSLQIETPPSSDFDNISGEGKGSELHLPQVTGYGKQREEDLTDYFKLLLSEYHGVDFFDDHQAFIKYLRRHIRRGLKEFRDSWRSGNDFHDYLYQEMLHVKDLTITDKDKQRREIINSALSEFGIKAKQIEIMNGPRIDRYIYYLKDVADFDRLRKGLDQIEFLTGISPLSFVEGIGEKRIALDVPRPPDEWYTNRIVEVTPEAYTDKGILPVFPGRDVSGNLVAIDMAEAPHLFVGGTTGSGKSVCLHAIIFSLLARPEPVQLLLADPKKIEFAPYEGLKCLWNEHVVSEPYEISDALEALIEEMEHRQDLFLDVNANNIEQAIAAGLQLPRIVAIIEELADLFLDEERAERACVRLAQKARATGIHLVLATQRPDAETFPGLLRSNIPSRIALSVRTSRESKIIIEQTGAERLLGSGDMIIRLIKGDPIRVQGFNVTLEDIERIVALTNERIMRE